MSALSAIGGEVAFTRSEGGAPVFDRILEMCSDRLQQAGRFLPREAACGPLRMDAGGKETLVGIDVADSRDEALIKQERLDAPEFCAVTAPSFRT